MSLNQYFDELIQKVENSNIVSNQGKDNDGFYKPTKTILIRHLNLLKDLHEKPLAKPMLQIAWKYVVEHMPPEHLILNEQQKIALKKAIG